MFFEQNAIWHIGRINFIVIASLSEKGHFVRGEKIRSTGRLFGGYGCYRTSCSLYNAARLDDFSRAAFSPTGTASSIRR